MYIYTHTHTHTHTHEYWSVYEIKLSWEPATNRTIAPVKNTFISVISRVVGRLMNECLSHL